MRVYSAPKRSIEDVRFTLCTPCLRTDSSSVTQQCQQLTGLLREIKDRVSVEDGNRIADVLDDVSPGHSACDRIDEHSGIDKP